MTSLIRLAFKIYRGMILDTMTMADGVRRGGAAWSPAEARGCDAGGGRRDEPVRRSSRGAGLRRRLAAVAGLIAVLWPLTASAADGPRIVVALGTSLTARGGWQAELARRLGDAAGHPVEVKTVAKSGGTSEWALDHLAEVVALRPDVVLIELHANDGAIDEWISPARSGANMDAILRSLRRDLPTSRFVVMAMNPMHGLRGAIRPFMSWYVDAHRDAAARNGAAFLDIGPMWNQLSDEDIRRAIPDGAHPSPEAAARIVAPTIATFLEGG